MHMNKCINGDLFTELCGLEPHTKPLIQVYTVPGEKKNLNYQGIIAFECFKKLPVCALFADRNISSEFCFNKD